MLEDGVLHLRWFYHIEQILFIQLQSSYNYQYIYHCMQQTCGKWYEQNYLLKRHIWIYIAIPEMFGPETQKKKSQTNKCKKNSILFQKLFYQAKNIHKKKEYTKYSLNKRNNFKRKEKNKLRDHVQRLNLDLGLLGVSLCQT